MAAGSKYISDDRLSEVLKNILNLTERVHYDFLQWNVLPDYNEEVYPLPRGLRQFIRKTVLESESSYRPKAFSSLLTNPNRIDCLIQSFINTFLSNSCKLTNSTFMTRTVICCLTSAILYRGGFIEAPTIAIETARIIFLMSGRSSAFKSFGCQIEDVKEQRENNCMCKMDFE